MHNEVSREVNTIQEKVHRTTIDSSYLAALFWTALGSAWQSDCGATERAVDAQKQWVLGAKCH